MYGLFTRTSPSPSRHSVRVRQILHRVNGDGPFDGENGFRTQSLGPKVRFHWHNVKLLR